MSLLPQSRKFISPVMYKVKQHLETTKLDTDQIKSELENQFQETLIKKSIKPNMNVAVAVGSRGITNISFIVKNVIRIIQEMGANPFIVPAMGSHGGGEPDGQVAILEHYGVSEEIMGVPIKPSMETVNLGNIEGTPIYFSKTALESDLIIPVCRVKPHTEFKGPVESGINKMLVVGLGKHLGASTIHNAGHAAF